MQFSYFVSFVLAIVPAINAAPSATTTNLAWDPVYDKGSNSLTLVACSDGKNGLITKGYDTFDSLPGWPYVGAVEAVTDYNDVDCGSCWNVTYTNSKKVSKSIFVTAIDVSGGGYVVGKNVMNELTGGRAVELGVVSVTHARVAGSHCGF